ncbi:hypothetical protein PR202_gb12600 [Eleusine coracana subsp. coracana]|uniref:Uncharacterized protein n=1 Tax=Eleusine coracana subsp. coracana TaxID=191504 RepID=A0AAV5ER08_ELECO|nr:hypothetical protein PR202_gb12600 [Eleusine coracana subsp. coracana]
MGPRGPVRYAYGKVLAQALSDREAYEADDQSALVYLLVTQPDRWKEKTFLESSYDLHGFWVDIVDRYEEMRRKGKSGLGDHWWPLVTHFVGCKPCGGAHESLNATAVQRVRNDTGGPLDADDKELARLLHPRFKASPKSGRRKKDEM